MLHEFRNWLGEDRLQLLALLFIVTGLASVVLQAVFPDAGWSLVAQTSLLLIFLAAALVIIGGRMPPFARQRLAFRFAPAMAAVLLGLIFQNWFHLFLGGALGWLIASQFLMRDVEKREYKLAIKALRRGEFDQGIEAMHSLIKKEPRDANHYGFRAQLYRLNGDMKRAVRDYEKVIELAPESGVGQNGLAEVYLQQEDFEKARQWAEAAYQQVPENWVAIYNLGMVAERQQDDQAARQYLELALEQGLPNSRHRLLTRFWLAKVYHRSGMTEQAQAMVRQLGREKSGLNEWKAILESKEADSVRHLLQADVRQAELLIHGQSLAKTFNAAG